MGKSLVIVESPAKAKTINKYLGPDYVVKSSVGHIRDLPTAGSGKNSSDPKERARQAAITRKMSPQKKVAHKKKKEAPLQVYKQYAPAILGHLATQPMPVHALVEKIDGEAAAAIGGVVQRMLEGEEIAYDDLLQLCLKRK